MVPVVMRTPFASRCRFTVPRICSPRSVAQGICVSLCERSVRTALGSNPFKGMIRETRGSELEAEQILDKVILFSTGQAQVHACVVVIDDRIQISETAVVIETTFEVCGERADGRSAITHIGSATGLKA